MALPAAPTILATAYHVAANIDCRNPSNGMSHLLYDYRTETEAESGASCLSRQTRCVKGRSDDPGRMHFSSSTFLASHHQLRQHQRC